MPGRHWLVTGVSSSFGEFLRGLVERSASEEAAKIAPAVTHLVEGAIVTAVIQGKPDATDQAISDDRHQSCRRPVEPGPL
jgi:hypothetical protein